MRLRADRRAYCDVPANHNDANAIHVLATSFPVIRRMVGEQSFRLMAQLFIMSNPPRFPIALSYGESFPSFLRTHCRVASIEYVADIAELEVARRKAQQAADARPINASVSRAWQAEHPNGVRVILHPSLHVVASRFPIVTIWENIRRGKRWRPEASLVARPFREVKIRLLPPGGHTFIGALARGQAVAMAARAAPVPDTTAHKLRHEQRTVP